MDQIAERAFRMRAEQRAPDRVSLERQAVVPKSAERIVSNRMLLALSLAAFCLPFAVVLMGLIVATAFGTPAATTAGRPVSNIALDETVINEDGPST